MRSRCALGLLVACTAVGCSKTGIERERPNQPPDTRVTSGPPDSIGGTSYRVQISWLGTDSDDGVDHYDVLVVDHPASYDSLNDVVQTFAIPAPDDPRWQATESTDSVFVVSADTLRRDPHPAPGETPDDVLRHFFDRWHTFFVRAVDHHGVSDPTPDYRTFNAHTLAPTVAMRSPVQPGERFETTPTAYLSWDGADPIDKVRIDSPGWSRWVCIRTRVDYMHGGWTSMDSLYHLPDSRWSPWQAWDAPDGSGTHAKVTNLFPFDQGGGFYLFAVQARDRAGAVTPVFDYQTPGKNNVAVLIVTGTAGPLLYVEEQSLGWFAASTEMRPQVQDVVAGQTLHFRWRGDASAYGGDIAGYRYAWDLIDESQPDAWECGWSPTCKSASRRFDSGEHRLLVEVRDRGGVVKSFDLRLTTHPLTRGRELLWVDDTVQPLPDDPREAQEDRRWLAVLDSLARRGGFDFDPSRDVYDVWEQRSNPPPLSKLFDYETVAWSVATTSGSALRQLALFFDPFVERNRNRVRPFNYVIPYIEAGGKLWVSGVLPAHAVWEVGINGVPFDRQLPVNVTNTQDPLSPHPEIDSVGVHSLLYEMGIEAFDVASADGRTPRRPTLDHGCVGPRRVLPPGMETQRFTSSAAASHTHQIALTEANLESPPAGGLTLTTDVQAGHSHLLQLTLSNLQALGRGERVALTTSSDAGHSHAFDLEDRSLSQGAPPVLWTDTGWAYPNDPQINPWRGRANIEIYNMPWYLATRQPPLVPPPGISTVLYTYRSGVPEDSSVAVFYPGTADRQPVLLVAKRSVQDPFPTRAWCSFEPYLLTFDSHLRLADFILLRTMRVGQTLVP